MQKEQNSDNRPDDEIELLIALTDGKLVLHLLLIRQRLVPNLLIFHIDKCNRLFPNLQYHFATPP